MESKTNAAPAPSAQPKSSRYPEPLVYAPSPGHPHRISVILLHGRGSDAAKFGPDLLASDIPSPSNKTLRDAFPSAKFIFPTASIRRATIYKRSPIHQWFDNWSLEHIEDREELQLDGLRQSSVYIHRLLQDEIDAVGAPNVVLGGLSQGCAAALIALLTWHGPPLAAVVGMCGWLPLRRHLEARARQTVERGDSPDHDLEDEFNPFATADDNDNDGEEERDPLQEAIRYLHEELGLPSPPPSSPLPFQKTNIFLTHGEKDDRVPLALGQEASSCLRALNVRVSIWKQYPDLGHWYSGEMLRDLVIFLNEALSDRGEGEDPSTSAV